MISKSSLYRYTINLIVIFLSLFTGFYITLNNDIKYGYEYLNLLPFSFGVFFILFFSKQVTKNKSVFLWIFTLFGILRYIVLPFSMVSENFYTGISGIPPSPESIKNGILLMLYELFISSVLIRILYRKTIYSTKLKCQVPTRRKTQKDYDYIYKIFILLTIILVIVKPNSLQGISFFTIFNRADSARSSSFTLLVRQFIMLSKMLLYFMIIKKFYRKYNRSGNIKYIWWTYLASIMNIGIFIGVNRKQILIQGIAVTATIFFLYPKEKKKTISIMLSVVGLIFLQLTIFRFYGNTNGKTFTNIASTLQVYLSGPYNMAMAIETKKIFGSQITEVNILYDIARPFYGIGLFFKQFTDLYLSTEYFNQRLSLGLAWPRGDQIMPITGQGLLHFGFIFSPIYLLIVINLGFIIDKIIKQTQNFEIRYILILFSAILGQVMGINLTIITNFITFEGILFYGIYWLNKKVNISMRKKYS